MATGKTDLLDKFISNKTRRPFKAFLAWNPGEGKVSFEFEPRTSKFPPRAGARGATAKTASSPPPKAKTEKNPAAASTESKRVATKSKAASSKPGAKAAAKPARTRKAPAGNLRPSAALAAVIGDGAVARTEVIKKLWDYIKAQGLQDAANKRAINADAKLRAVFGKDQVTMFELAGIVGKHLVAG